MRSGIVARGGNLRRRGWSVLVYVASLFFLWMVGHYGAAEWRTSPPGGITLDCV